MCLRVCPCTHAHMLAYRYVYRLRARRRTFMQTTLDEATQFNAVEMHAVRRPSGARWAANAAPTPADWGEPQPSAPSVPRTPRVAADASLQGRGSGRGSGQVEAVGVDEELMFGIGGSMTTGRIMSAVPARFQSSQALSSDPSDVPVRWQHAMGLDTHTCARAHTHTHTHTGPRGAGSSAGREDSD